jgi:hypothetical protein
LGLASRRRLRRVENVVYRLEIELKLGNLGGGLH